MAEASLRRCLGVEQEASETIAHARSDDFVKVDAREESSASSEATAFRSEAEAERAFDSYAVGLRRPRAEQCAVSYVHRLLAGHYRGEVAVEYASVVPLSDVTPAEAEVFGEPSFFPPPGLDGGNAWAIAVAFHVCCGEETPPTLDEDPPTAYVELALLREGHLLNQLQTFNVSSPLLLRDELVSALAKRMTG